MLNYMNVYYTRKIPHTICELHKNNIKHLYIGHFKNNNHNHTQYK